MKNLRYADSGQTIVQAEDEAGNTVNIPTDPANRHYAEILAQLEEGGAEVADYAPDPAAVEGARQQKVAARMMELIADDANAGKSLDQIRAEAKVLVAAGQGSLLRTNNTNCQIIFTGAEI